MSWRNASIHHRALAIRGTSVKGSAPKELPAAPYPPAQLRGPVSKFSQRDATHAHAGSGRLWADTKEIFNCTGGGGGTTSAPDARRRGTARQAFPADLIPLGVHPLAFGENGSAGSRPELIARAGLPARRLHAAGASGASRPVPGHPRPSRCHADDGWSAPNCGRAVAARRIGEECQQRSLFTIACPGRNRTPAIPRLAPGLHTVLVANWVASIPDNAT